MAGAKNTYLKFWHWSVLGAPIWWFLGLNLGIYHAVSLLLFLGMLQSSLYSGKPIFLSVSSIFIFLYAVIYAFSLFINALSAEDFMRVIASAYNLSYWMMGAALVTVMSNVFSLSDIRAVLKTFSRTAWVIAFLTLFTFILMLTGVRTLGFPTPLYGLTEYLGHMTLVENSLVVKMLYWEWFASTLFPRFNLFSPYAVASGEILALVLIMLVSYAGYCKKTKNPIFVAISLCVFFAMLMTLSRMPLIAFMAGAVIVFLTGKPRPLVRILLFISVLFCVYPWLDNAINFILNLRTGSTVGRLELYRYSLSRLEGIEWILGKGIKPRDEWSLLGPTGSHSTYISVVFRTGLLGIAVFLGFQLYLLRSWYRLKSEAVKSREVFFLWQGLGWAFITMFMCMATDDIDVPQFVAFLYFSLVGVFEGLRRRLLLSGNNHLTDSEGSQDGKFLNRQGYFP